jgi:hypothetical protein
VSAALPPEYETWRHGAAGAVVRRDVASAVRAALRRGLCVIGPIKVDIREGEAALATALA